MNGCFSGEEELGRLLEVSYGQKSFIAASIDKAWEVSFPPTHMFMFQVCEDLCFLFSLPLNNLQFLFSVYSGLS